jgi:predicted amidohydrolase
MSNRSAQFTVCAIQPATVWQEPGVTFERIERQAALARRAVAPDLILLPEHFNGVWDEDGATAEWNRAQRFAAELARASQAYVVAGSVEHWEAGRRVNSAVLYNRQGEEIGRYRKRQLFGFEKQRSVSPGAEPFVAQLDGVRCGIVICADLWYPELVRPLAARIDLLCVPAQTTMRPESPPAYARMLWHTLAMTRAQENVVAVLVSDHAISAEAPFRCGGVASVTDPSAQPDLSAIQRTIADGGAGFAAARLDLARLARFRAYRQENGLLPVLAPD